SKATYTGARRAPYPFESPASTCTLAARPPRAIPNSLARRRLGLVAGPSMPSGRDVGRLCLLLLAYASLTVWLTWPLGGALASRLPCTDAGVCPFDTVYSAWVVSWISHALTTMPWHVADANIYYPDPQALYYGPAGLGAIPYALPAFVATGNPAVAINTAF